MFDRRCGIVTPHARPGTLPYMRSHFEFTFHTLAAEDAAGGDVDPTLALLGSQGWEIRSITTLADGRLTVALQRPYDEELPLPDAPTMHAALAEPLTVPD